MPYFYLKSEPAYRRIYRHTLILPHQTHLGAENALFLRRKRTPGPKNLSEYPYFAVRNAQEAEKHYGSAAVLPETEKVLILPYETPQAIGIPLFCRTKRPKLSEYLSFAVRNAQ